MSLQRLTSRLKQWWANARTPPARTILRHDAYAMPQRPAAIGVVAIIAFLVALTLWGTLAPVSGAAIANGQLQVEGKRQTVQHPYGGVVKKLLVREGDVVTKGQVLMTLFDSEPRSKLEVAQAESNALKAQEARLIAERDGASEPTFTALSSGKEDPAVRQAMANERATMAARKQQFDTETDVLRKKLAQLQEQMAGMRAQIAGAERQQALLEEETAGARELLGKGFAPKTRVLALERDLARLEADRASKRSELARMEHEAAQTNLEIARLDRNRIGEITDQLRTTQSKIVELAPRIDAARDVVQRTEIVAPASGAVVGLTVFTEGGVIQSGAKLLDIVPSGSPLIVDARLRLTDISEVVPGRPADVRLTSINHTERPLLSGTIYTVSADRVTDEQSGDAYYAIQVTLNPDEVRKSRIDLQAGMPAEVIVTTRPRTLVEYLVSPLTDELTRAFRER